MLGDHMHDHFDLILTRIIRADDGHISGVTYEHDRLRDLVSPRTYYALRRNGFYHPDQVRDTSDEELLSCLWIGQKSLYEIRRALG